MTGLWKTWITIWCWGVILFGVLLAGAAFPATDAGVRYLYGLLSSVRIEGDFLAAPGIRFSIALMGAVSIGWGCTMLFLLPVIHAAGAPAWRGLTAAIAVWFVIDGAMPSRCWRAAHSNPAPDSPLEGKFPCRPPNSMPLVRFTLF